MWGSGRLTHRGSRAALELVRAKIEKETTVRHLVSVEGIMRRLGGHFGEDEELWALGGLFHDLDQDQTHDDIDRHAYLAAEWLREAGVDERVVNIALAHAHPTYRTDLPSKAIVHADAWPASSWRARSFDREGHGDEGPSVRKKVKEKAFAPGVAREDIHAFTEGIGLDLEVFISLGIEGLQLVAEIEL